MRFLRRARLVYSRGTRAALQVVETFGADVLAEDGTVDRKALGAKVFSDANLVRPAWGAFRFW